MRVFFTTTPSWLRTHLLGQFCLLIGLTVAAHSPSFSNVPPGSRPAYRLPGRTGPGTLLEGPQFRDRFGRLPLTTADPIRFRLQCNKQTVRLGESVDLTITAELLAISSNLLFSLPGANAYRLKLLLPPGFVQTGGDFSDYVGGELSYPSRTVATYHLTGYFTSVPPDAGFRLLRSHAQADGQSLFVEKAAINLKSVAAGTGLPAAKPRLTQNSEATPVLYVVSETAPSGARVAAANYVGYLEFANCDLIGGWAADLNSLRESVSLDIFINGAKAATIVANQDRQDVADARRSSYNKYGFRWVVPNSYKRNAPLTFAVKISDSPVELTGSPIRTAPCPGTVVPQDSCRFAVTTAASAVSAACGGLVTLQADCQGADCSRARYTWTGNGLNQTGRSIEFNAPSANGQYRYTVTASVAGCASQTATATVAVSGCVLPSVAPEYRGFLDSVSCDSLRGWAFDQKALQQSVSVDVYINGIKMATVLANSPRPDVARAYNVQGFNQYGYRIAIPSSFRNNAPLNVAVRIAGSPFELEFSPRQTGVCLSNPLPPLPPPPPPTPVTCGNSVTLRVDCPGADCSQMQFTWTGNGLNMSGQSVTFTPPTTNGTYSYTVTATKPGCPPQTSTASVIVSGCGTTPPPTTPACSFSLSAASTSVSCGSAVVLRADCQGTDCNQVSYAWTGQGITQSGQSVSFTAPSTNGVYSYTVTATKAGCSAQTAVASVTVSGCGTTPPPTTPACSFTIVAPSTSAACGSTVTLNADCLSNNCDQVSYAWSGPGLSRNGQQQVSFTVPTTNGVYSYTVTATKAGCSAQTAVASVTVTGCTTTPPSPAPCSFSITVPSTSINCRSAVVLRADCQGTDCNQVSYAWTGQGITQSGQSVTVSPPATDGTYSYTVTATKAGCSAQTAVANVTVSGCGTTPPPTTPACSFTIVAPSTSAACGSTVTLNADCLSNNCDQVSYAWSGPGLSRNGQQQVSFTVPTTNGVYSYTVTATKAGCSAQTAVANVTVTGCTTTPPPSTSCLFSITAQSPTVGCRSAVTLRADCQGTDCSQVSYAWAGPGLNQNGQQINFTAPSANGVYSYTVTATKAGCSAQIAIVNVTVNGCAPPPAPGTYPILDSPQPADKRPILDNGRIRLAIDLGVGGVIREVTDLQVGENMINCMVKSNGLRDPGRDDQISLYGLPSDSRNWTVNNKPVLEDIGYNPVQGGDVAGNFSPILGYGRTNDMLYSKTRGLHWGINNEPGDYVVEQWIRLEGNTVRRHVRITGDRPDMTRYPEARQQELPCTYTNSAYYQYYVVQGEPYTNAPLINVNTIPNLTGTGRLDQHTGGTNGPYNIDASEPWIVAVRPNTNRGIALHTPYSHEFKVALFNEIGYGPAESDDAGYIANTMSLILDRNGVYEFDINMVVGTLSEIRSTVNTLPRSETRPNYVFDGNATRHGFYYRKGYDQGYPITGELAITPTDRRFKIVSPRKAYRAASIDTLYVRMRISSPETKLILEWRKVGQSELSAAQANQTITFDVRGDNQYRTIAIPVKNHPLWNGQINDFAIRYTIQTETPLSNHEVGIKWISATNLGIP